MEKVCLKEEVFENLLNLALKNCETSLDKKINPSSFISIPNIPSIQDQTSCGTSKYGCCEGTCIARKDIQGSNCEPRCIPGDLPIPPGAPTYKPYKSCSITEFGCCPGSCTARNDISGKSCDPEPRRCIRK